MARTTKVLGPDGSPVKVKDLTDEIAAPTMGGVRSPITGYPADGLTPLRLTSLLRAADHGDPVGYLELAEAIEERDLHYLGVLGTRRRAVCQLPIDVELGEETPIGKEIADRIRAWLTRDELKDELFDILDAIGKAYGFTEIIWDFSEGQIEPGKLTRRDQRWFRFDRADLETPLMLDPRGQELPLPPYKFIYATMKAKSGLPLRSGLARAAMWAYLFKKYTERDWAIFTQTYGQPIRIGKYGPGTSEEERDKLFRAVAGIAGDCAAIIPESMMIEFVQAQNIGSSVKLYEERADWLDRQVSKLVLGQTATTDAVTGGLGSGKEHREVQEDIETSDAGKLAAILNRDLIRPWVDMEWGPQPAYPRLKISRPEAEDLHAFSEALTPLLGAGLQVKAEEVREKFSLSKPEGNDEILGGTPKNSPPPPNSPGERGAKGPAGRFEYRFNGENGNSGTDAALQASEAPAGVSDEFDPMAILLEELTETARPAMDRMMADLQARIDAAGSLEELREFLHSGLPEIKSGGLVETLTQAFRAAHLGGRALIENEAAENGDGRS